MRLILRNKLGKFMCDPIVQSTIVLSLVALSIVYWWAADKTVMPENYDDQPILFRAFMFVNFPPIALTGSLFYFLALDWSQPVVIWFYYATLIGLYLLQWATVGKVISETVFDSKTEKRNQEEE